MPPLPTPTDPADRTPILRPGPPPWPPALPCANCGTPLAGPYCSECGQHTRDYHRSVWRFLHDFLDNTFCWDNKLLLTAQPLLRQPGFLTREFVYGRRVRYVHPLRLFLFTSAVCLALIGFIYHHPGGARLKRRADRSAMVRNTLQAKAKARAATPAPIPPEAGVAASSEKEDEDDQPAAYRSAPRTAKSAASATPASDSLAAKIQQVLAESTRPPGTPGGTPAPSPAAEASPAVSASPTSSVAPKIGSGLPDDFGSRIDQAVQPGLPQNGGISPEVQRKLDELEKMDLPKINQVVDAISQGVENRLSWVALALLPVFALFVRATYWRRDSYYFEHLVFSLHYHSFLFIFWAAYVVASILITFLPFQTGWNLLLAGCLLVPAWYLYASLRRMYGESPRRTLVKTLLISSLHLLSILIGVSVVGALAFFSMPK